MDDFTEVGDQKEVEKLRKESETIEKENADATNRVLAETAAPTTAKGLPAGLPVRGSDEWLEQVPRSGGLPRAFALRFVVWWLAAIAACIVHDHVNWEMLAGNLKSALKKQDRTTNNNICSVFHSFCQFQLCQCFSSFRLRWVSTGQKIWSGPR